MPAKIRLSRGGTKKRPYYRIVVADSRAPRDGSFIEKIGTYDPMLPKDHENRVTFKEERLDYWLGVGAQPTDRIHRFLAKMGKTDARAIPKQTKKDKPKAKAQERLREAQERAAAASEAETGAGAEPAPGAADAET